MMTALIARPLRSPTAFVHLPSLPPAALLLAGVANSSIAPCADTTSLLIMSSHAASPNITLAHGFFRELDGGLFPDLCQRQRQMRSGGSLGAHRALPTWRPCTPSGVSKQVWKSALHITRHRMLTKRSGRWKPPSTAEYDRLATTRLLELVPLFGNIHSLLHPGVLHKQWSRCLGAITLRLLRPWAVALRCSSLRNWPQTS